jgi:hypothetical protein
VLLEGILIDYTSRGLFECSVELKEYGVTNRENASHKVLAYM